MDTALWVCQGIGAAVFLMAGATKLLVPKERLAPMMGYVNDFTQGQVRLIGLAEVLGAIGLVLPMWLGIAPVLTPVAAVALAVLMAGAVQTHVRRGEGPMTVPPIVLLALCVFIAYGRFG